MPAPALAGARQSRRCPAADLCSCSRAGLASRLLLLATSVSLAISAERPAISECRCATLAGAGLVSVPARERNQGSWPQRSRRRTARTRGCPRCWRRGGGREQFQPKTCSANGAVLPPRLVGPAWRPHGRCVSRPRQLLALDRARWLITTQRPPRHAGVAVASPLAWFSRAALAGSAGCPADRSATKLEL